MATVLQLYISEQSRLVDAEISFENKEHREKFVGRKLTGLVNEGVAMRCLTLQRSTKRFSNFELKLRRNKWADEAQTKIKKNDPVNMHVCPTLHHSRHLDLSEVPGTKSVVTNVNYDSITVVCETLDHLTTLKIMTRRNRPKFDIVLGFMLISYERMKLAASQVDQCSRSAPVVILPIHLTFTPIAAVENRSDQPQFTLSTQEVHSNPLSSHALHVLPLRFFNEALNNSQKECVRVCLQKRYVAAIHGPPGRVTFSRINK